MKILVINVGSSSVKFVVFGGINYREVFRAKISTLKNNKETFAKILAILKNNDLEKFDIISHRVVHSGQGFDKPAVINKIVINKLKKLINLAPNHQKNIIDIIESFVSFYSKIPQVACFDTSFHQTQNPVAKLFALPETYAKQGVIRYGFHGLSYQYIADILPKYIGGKALAKVMVAHLGSGSSVCAMQNLKSVATTMSMTPLDGLMMATRCGNIDPGAVLYLLEEKKMSVNQVKKLLYEESGLKGVSGISGDVEKLQKSKTAKAKLAIELFCYQAAKQLASLIPALGGFDVLVFTGGVGENSALIRYKICQQFSWLGLKLSDKNSIGKISSNDSKIEVYVIATNEELVIAKQSYGLIKS